MSPAAASPLKTPLSTDIRPSDHLQTVEDRLSASMSPLKSRPHHILAPNLKTERGRSGTVSGHAGEAEKSIETVTNSLGTAAGTSMTASGAADAVMHLIALAANHDISTVMAWSWPDQSQISEICISNCIAKDAENRMHNRASFLCKRLHDDRNCPSSTPTCVSSDSIST